MSLQHHTELEAQRRELTAKGGLRALRASGRVPAVVYGGERDPEFLSLSLKDLAALCHRGRLLSHAFVLNVNGERQRAVLSCAQFEPVKDRIIHVDFRRVSSQTSLEVEVPLVFEGQDACAALTREGGVLNVAVRALKILCPAEDIPERISVDVSHMSMGSVLRVRDVKLPSGVKSVGSPDGAVATVAHPKEERETDASGVSPADVPASSGSIDSSKG